MATRVRVERETVKGRKENQEYRSKKGCQREAVVVVDLISAGIGFLLIRGVLAELSSLPLFPPLLPFRFTVTVASERVELDLDGRRFKGEEVGDREGEEDADEETEPEWP
jgi:hypothetical protein